MILDKSVYELHIIELFLDLLYAIYSMLNASYPNYEPNWISHEQRARYSYSYKKRRAFKTAKEKLAKFMKKYTFLYLYFSQYQLMIYFVTQSKVIFQILFLVIFFPFLSISCVLLIITNSIINLYIWILKLVPSFLTGFFFQIWKFFSIFLL